MAPSVAASGITTDNSTGERHIPSSTRADGSQRREIRVRPGYRPPEDVELYKNRAATSFRNRGAGGIPGAEGVKGDAAAASATSAGGTTNNKNAKKREAKRKAKAADGENNITQVDSPSEQPAGALEKESWRPGMNNTETAAAAEETVDPELEKEKKARNLKKKLRQARDLREKKDKGENLLPEQFEKVIKMQELIRQLDVLGFDANGEKKQVEKPTAAGDEKGGAV